LSSSRKTWARPSTDTDTDQVLKPFVIARDLTQVDRRARVIGFYPRIMEQARAEFPCLFQ